MARLDSSGNLLGISQWGTNGNDYVRGSAPDGAGGVFLSGYTNGSFGAPSKGGIDAWVARVDSSGTMLWSQQVGSTGEDKFWTAAPDGSGGVFACGFTNGDLGGPTAGTLKILARFDAAGNPLWVRKYPFELLSGAVTVDKAFASCSDGVGGGYLQTWTLQPLTAPMLGGWDVVWAHHDATGNIDWVSQFGSDSSEGPRDIAADGSGGFLAIGNTLGSITNPNQGVYDVWIAQVGHGCIGMETYCSPSATSIPGCVPAISGVGPVSLFNPQLFQVRCESVPGGNLGLCILTANGAASIPFGSLGGVLCVQPPFFRTGPAPSGGTTGGCDGGYAFTLADLLNAAPILVPGADVRAQVWARDPANPDGFLLSDGLHFSLCP